MKILKTQQLKTNYPKKYTNYNLQLELSFQIKRILNRKTVKKYSCYENKKSVRVEKNENEVNLQTEIESKSRVSKKHD